MVHWPLKSQRLRVALLALAAMPFMAVQTRGQESAPPSPAQFDPSDVYFQGYLAARNAEQLEAQGDFIGAAEKLEQSRKLLEGVRRHFPDWKKDMVTGRFAKTTESLESIRPKADEQRRKNEGVVADLEGIKSPGRLGDTIPDPIPGILQADPIAARRLADADAEVQRLRQSMANPSSSDSAENSRNASRVGDLERQRDLLAAQLRAAEANAENLRNRLGNSPVQGELDSLGRRIEGLEQEREAMARALAQSRGAQSEALSKIATLEADLTNLTKQTQDLRQKEADLNRNMATERNIANEVVAGQRRQLEALEKALTGKTEELQKANERIAGLQLELKQSRDSFEEIRAERDLLVQERDQMEDLLKLNESERITKLIEQNLGLAKELREANEKVERLNLDNNATKDQLTEAYRDRAVAKSKIIDLTNEKRAQAQRIVDLERRLKGEEAALAGGEASADPAEIATLRDIIKRQLRVQERRRQARDLILNAVKEMGVQDEQLASAVELFDGQELQLTPDEQKLLTERQADGEFISPFARDRATVGRATTDLNKELESYDRAATKAFAAERYHPARELFQMVLDANPGDTTALCKLGVVQLRLSDAVAAADCFRRAVELDTNNPYAHRMLGYSLYSLGDLAGAEENAARSVDLAPEDAISQAFLGGIQFKLEKYSEAESHFKAAIAADPMPSDPYFNLAHLCAKKERFDDARNFYNLALERGAVPDPNLEQILTQ